MCIRDRSDAELPEGFDESNFIDGYYLDVDKMLYNEILAVSYTHLVYLFENYYTIKDGKKTSRKMK